MDIKLKNNQNKLIINTMLIFTLVLSSIGMYATYPRMKAAVDKQSSNFSYDSGLLSQIRESNYAIYYDLLNKEGNKNLKPSDVFLKNTSVLESYTLDDIKNIKSNFDNDFYNYRRNLENNKNLQYYAIDKQSKLSDGRNQNEIISLLNNKEFNENTAGQFNDKYAFYLVIDYNEAGVMTINKIHGIESSTVDEILNRETINHPEGYEVSPIKNMTYVYAVPNKLMYHDNIYDMKQMAEYSSYNHVSTIYMNIAALLMLIIALIVPYKISKETIGFKIISRIPIEIMFIIFACAFAFGYSQSHLLINETMKNDLLKSIWLELDAGSIRATTDLINIIYWTIGFAVVFYLATLIKHIFITGIKEYFKQNSIIIRISRFLLKEFRNAAGDLRNIDLKNKNTKKLLVLLSVNFIILLIISVTWFFGIILAAIYSIVLFRLIRKNYNDISNKYKILHDSIEEIASGNLEVSVEEDLGIFNDLKEEIQSIQNGFKNAVYEEVKSQRMKTELISNVSHDLKTPLTAIITYVDLLKDETLVEDKRREYLNILDIKSQRLKDLIEDLFEVSKANSGNINLNIDDVDVVALMKQTLLEVDDKLSKANLKIKTNYPEEKVMLPLDGQRTYRVFENLLINAAKYAMPGSRVYVHIISDIDEVQIVIKNTSADEIRFKPDEIVERFVRGDKSRNTEGTGLGLAIAKSFVEIQGGQLEIQVDGDLFKVIMEFKKKSK